MNVVEDINEGLLLCVEREEEGGQLHERMLLILEHLGLRETAGPLGENIAHLGAERKNGVDTAREQSGKAASFSNLKLPVVLVEEAQIIIKYLAESRVGHG